MRATTNGAQSPTTPNAGNTTTNASTHPAPHNNNNNNSSSSRTAGSGNTENSGSQYALCALGLGLLALGTIMIVWSEVPADGGADSDNSTSEDGGGGGGGGSGGGGGGIQRPNRNKVSSVAFVLVGSGAVMLLLSLCLGFRNTRRERLGLREAEQRRQAELRRQTGAPAPAETPEEQAQQFAVPSYEEVVGSGQYPVRNSNLRQSATHLPSYEDLVDQADGVHFENEGVAVAAGDPSATPPEAPTGRRGGKAARKLIPLKIRRIKSEKLRVQGAVDASQAPASLEPLTPPPQYEDKVPPI